VLDDRSASSAGGSPQGAGGRVDVVLVCIRQYHDDDAWILEAQRCGADPFDRRFQAADVRLFNRRLQVSDVRPRSRGGDSAELIACC
jgi:hypothetical protein